MVTEAVPVVAFLLAVNVSTLVPAVGFLLNFALTPPGSPEAARVTLPLNPFRSDTEMVELPEEPWVTVTDAGEALRLKLGAGLTVNVTVAVAPA